MGHPRWHLIEQKSDQIIKIRTGLNDLSSPPGEISRPKTIKKYIFECRIARLEALERRVEELLMAELSRYMRTKERQRGTKSMGETRGRNQNWRDQNRGRSGQRADGSAGDGSTEKRENSGRK